jgi:hypothetical protein
MPQASIGTIASFSLLVSVFFIDVPKARAYTLQKRLSLKARPGPCQRERQISSPLLRGAST